MFLVYYMEYARHCRARGEVPESYQRVMTYAVLAAYQCHVTFQEIAATHFKFSPFKRCNQLQPI